MPDKLILGVYSSGGPSGALQLAINHVTERGTGDGYRFAGPGFAGANQKVLEHTVSEEDAAVIRRYLDTVFPRPDARRWAELKEYLDPPDRAG